MSDTVYREPGEFIPVILPKTHCLIWLCREPIEDRGYCSLHLRAGQAGTCKVAGCERIVRCKGLCHNHYKETTVGKPCSVEGCEKASHGKGLCKSHYNIAYKAARRQRAA